MPTNMGTLYWQLNDCWPVASWATVDSYNNWKAAMYGIKDAYADVVIALDSTDKKNWTVNITNDLMKAYSGTLLLSIHDFSGKEYDRNNIPLTVAKQTTTIVEIGDLISKRSELNGLYAKATFVAANKIVAANHFNFCKPFYLKLSKPYIKIEPINSSSFAVSSNVFAKFVELNLPSTQVHFSDNYFDLLPNEKKIITFTSEKQLQDITNKIIVRSLADMY
jgi:beta-mannosidase